MVFARGGHSSPTQFPVLFPSQIQPTGQGMNPLSPERTGMTTASTAPIICAADTPENNDKRHRLWRERIGDVEREDLRDTFEVQWGKYCEPFVLDWIEKTERSIIDERQQWCPHPTLPKIGATLDGYRKHDDAVIEVKVLSPFTAAKEFYTYYAPQVAVQIACRGATRGFLAVQQGNSAPQLFEVLADASYINEVLARLSAFQICVDTRNPPGPVPAPPVPAERWRVISLDTDVAENWAQEMRETLSYWKHTRDHAIKHEGYKKLIKSILPDEVGRITYGPFVVRRARNGAVSIGEEAA